MTGRPRRIVFALAALACATCATTTAPALTAHAFPVQEFTLPSGLKVVIEHDDVSSIAGIVVVVDAGSVDDPKGKSGMAHVLEHLVFRVAEEGGKSLWNQLVGMGAASFNAETDIERTTYHAFGPRQALDELVAAVLGRLADPLRGATEHDVGQEVSITAEELRKKEGAQGWEFVVPALLPPGDLVGRAFAEHRRSDQLSLADVRAFADAFYRPERMTVVISGPIAFGWEKALFAKLPASWRGQQAKPTAPIRRPLAAWNPPSGPASPDAGLPTHTAKVNAPELWMAWRVPPAIGVDARKAFMISRVLDVVLSSRLDPDGTNDVLDVDGFAIPGALSTVVGCRFKLRAAGDAVRIRNETKAALEALSDATLVHIKGRLYWSHVIALQLGTLMTALDMETIERRALVRAELAHGGSNALISTVLGALEKVTSDDLTDYAARYLKPEAARAVLVVPAGARTPGARPSDAAGGAPDDPITAPGAEPDRDGFDVKGDEADLPDQAKLLATTQIPGARAALVRKLSNGLTVIAMQRPGMPFVSMILGFHADPQPGDAPGAPYAYRRVLRWDVSEGPLERGLARWCEHEADRTQETLRMFATSVDKALDYLSEEADSLHVFWPNPVFERWLDGTAIDEATAEGRAARTFRSALFGTHAYRLEPTTAEMRKVTEREVQAWFARVWRPANGALVVVGELNPEDLIRRAERTLRGWKGDRASPPAPPAPPPAPAAHAPTDVVVAGSGAARAVYTEDTRRRLADIQFGCFLPPVRTPRDEIVGRMLATLLSDGLRSNLRWRKAVSYSPQVHVETVRGGTSWISGRVDVDARAQIDALDLLHLWLDDGAAMPIDPRRFEQLRWYTARRSGLMNATGHQLASSLFEAWNMGWEPAALDDYPRDLAGVTAKDVTAALDVCRRSAVISVLGPGPDPGQ